MNTTPVTPATNAGLCRVPEILATCSIGRSTLWRLVKEGRFPAPLRPSPFGKAVTSWRREDIAAFCRGEWKPEAAK